MSQPEPDTLALALVYLERQRRLGKLDEGQYAEAVAHVKAQAGGDVEEFAEHPPPPGPAPMPASLQLRRLMGDTVYWSESQQRWVVGDDPGFDPDEESGPHEFAEEDWVNEPGPRSRNRWRNVRTGHVAYGAHNPGGQAHRAAAAEQGKARKARAQEAMQKRIAGLKGTAPRVEIGSRYSPGDRAAQDQAAGDFVGAALAATGLAESDLHRLVGAQGGSEVRVLPKLGGEWEGRSLTITVSHPAIEHCTRTISLTDDGELVCHNDLFFLDKAAQRGGFGMAQFGAQVRGLAEIGADRIDTLAGKGGGMNGYYTWARFGYDADLDRAWVRKVPGRAEKLFLASGATPEDAQARAQALAGARTVQDLMASEDGRAVWKKHGYMVDMSFDLSPGSKSLEVLNAYLVSKGKPPVEPDPEKVAALRAARKQALAAGAPAREERRRKAQQEQARQQAARLEAAQAERQKIDARFAGNAQQAGLSYEDLLGRVEAKEKEYEGFARANPADPYWSDPAKRRNTAWANVWIETLVARHKARMADPQLTHVHEEWARQARAKGVSPAELRKEAADYPRPWADAAQALDEGYDRALQAILRRREAAG